MIRDRSLTHCPCRYSIVPVKIFIIWAARNNTKDADTGAGLCESFQVIRRHSRCSVFTLFKGDLHYLCSSMNRFMSKFCFLNNFLRLNKSSLYASGLYMLGPLFWGGNRHISYITRPVIMAKNAIGSMTSQKNSQNVIWRRDSHRSQRHPALAIRAVICCWTSAAEPWRRKKEMKRRQLLLFTIRGEERSLLVLRSAQRLKTSTTVRRWPERRL